MEIAQKAQRQRLLMKSPWQTFNMRYLPCQTRAEEGHVSLPSVMGDRQAQQRGTVVRCRSRRSRRYEIPPWSQSYLRMLRTDGEERRRGCSSIFWGHIKVCSMGSHWPGVPEEVATTFYYQHLKRCRSPWASTPPLLLFFTVPPNDTCACV